MKKDYDIFVPIIEDKTMTPGMNQITKWCYAQIGPEEKELVYNGKYLYSGLTYHAVDSVGYIPFFSSVYEGIIILNIGKTSIANYIYENLMNYYEDKR